MTEAIAHQARSWVLSPGYHDVTTALGLIALALLVAAITAKEMARAAAPMRDTALSRTLDAAIVPLLVAFVAIIGLRFAVDILGWRP